MLMAKTTPQIHRFRVHARGVDHHHAHVLEESSFEAAAVAYLEIFGDISAGDQEIRVIVRNLDDGHEHCFIIDLDTGERRPAAKPADLG
jgi:hypothetical protein